MPETHSSFVARIGDSWLQAAAMAHGVMAALPPMGADDVKARWRGEHERCLRQGQLVLNLAAGELDVRKAA